MVVSAASAGHAQAARATALGALTTGATAGDARAGAALTGGVSTANAQAAAQTNALLGLVQVAFAANSAALSTSSGRATALATALASAAASTSAAGLAATAAARPPAPVPPARGGRATGASRYDRGSVRSRPAREPADLRRPARRRGVRRRCQGCDRGHDRASAGNCGSRRFLRQSTLKFIYNVATLIITHSLTTELIVTDFKSSAQLTVTDSRTTELTVTHSATTQLT